MEDRNRRPEEETDPFERENDDSANSQQGEGDPNREGLQGIETAEPGTREGVDKGKIVTPHDGAPPTEDDLKEDYFQQRAQKVEDREELNREQSLEEGGNGPEKEGNEAAPRPKE